jgi:hypothetical protein
MLVPKDSDENGIDVDFYGIVVSCPCCGSMQDSGDVEVDDYVGG